MNTDVDSTVDITNEIFEKKLKECERSGTKTLEFSNKSLSDILFFSAFNLQHVQVNMRRIFELEFIFTFCFNFLF